MEQLLVFLIASLATFRLAFMFSSEIGPCRIFERLRAIPKPDGCWAKGISCFFCESVWWSAAITAYLAFSLNLNLQAAPIYWLAVSAASILIHSAWRQEDK